AAQAESHAAEIDVLPAAQLGMEPRADLEQGSDAAAQLEGPLARVSDTRQELEEGALPRAVAADHAHDLAWGYLHTDIAERPKIPGRRLLPAEEPPADSRQPLSEGL